MLMHSVQARFRVTCGTIAHTLGISGSDAVDDIELELAK